MIIFWHFLSTLIFESEKVFRFYARFFVVGILTIFYHHLRHCHLDSHLIKFIMLPMITIGSGDDDERRFGLCRRRPPALVRILISLMLILEGMYILTFMLGNCFLKHFLLNHFWWPLFLHQFLHTITHDYKLYDWTLKICFLSHMLAFIFPNFFVCFLKSNYVVVCFLFSFDIEMARNSIIAKFHYYYRRRLRHLPPFFHWMQFCFIVVFGLHFLVHNRP